MSPADILDRFTAWFTFRHEVPTWRNLGPRLAAGAALGVVIGLSVAGVRLLGEQEVNHAYSALYLSQPGREAILGEILNRCERGEESRQQCASAENAAGGDGGL